MAKAELNAVLAQRIEVTPGLIIIRVAPDGWELPEFKSGQFLVLGMPGSAPRSEGSDPESEAPDPDKLIRRAYSIASASVSRQFVEIYVALVSSGALTPRLFALKVSDRLWMGKKITGMFTLEPIPEDRHLVLVATGTGLAPYMSMLRSNVLGAGKRKVVVLLGARHSWDLGYQSELSILENHVPSFNYLPVISRPQAETVPWAGRVGYVQDLWKNGTIEELWGFKPEAANTHVLLCGNPAMIEDMVTLLEGEDYKEHKRKDPGQIHLERYW